MPPDIITTIVLLFVSIFLFNKALAATAPPGSTTNFKFSANCIIVFFTSSSLTDKPLINVFLLIAKVMSPGCRANKASQIDVNFLVTGLIEFSSKDIFVSSKLSGSTE